MLGQICHDSENVHLKIVSVLGPSALGFIELRRVLRGEEACLWPRGDDSEIVLFVWNLFICVVNGHPLYTERMGMLWNTIWYVLFKFISKLFTAVSHLVLSTGMLTMVLQEE